MQTYWFITVFEKMEYDTKYSGLNTGCSRCWGFYTSKETALKALHHNWTDMWETIYDYAVLEEYYEGIGNISNNRQFFKYNQKQNGYFEIEEPEYAKYILNFAIG